MQRTITERTADVARYRLGIGQPIIAAMMHDPGAIHSVEQARNAKNKARFYARWIGQEAPKLRLWR